MMYTHQHAYTYMKGTQMLTDQYEHRRIIDESSIGTEETPIRVHVEVWESAYDTANPLVGITTTTMSMGVGSKAFRVLSETTLTASSWDDLLR